ncbi:MAG: hypothetical protein IKL25_08525 [Clostridia bacterium]|nr:hypothetical protein [Clostridia bacterium]
MKKFFLMLLALMLAATTLTAFAEEDSAIPSPEAEEIVLLEGFVMEVLDESILLQTRDGLYVEALLTPDTVLEGKEPAIGDYVSVAYNGMMTRSIPAQITAIHIGNHMLMGLVSELTEDSFLLTFGEEVYQVNADAALLEGIQDGMFVTVYHKGMMTMSLPAQVIALHIRGQEIVGTVTEMVEGGFTLTVEGEELPYHVAIKEGALEFVQAEPGMEVIVIIDGMMTASLESILVNAVEILPLPAVQEVFDMTGVVTEIGEGFIMIEDAEGQMIQVNLSEETISEGKDVEVGDFIHVTYNGQMTFSIPAQIAAQKIGCYAHTGVIGEITEGQFALVTEMELILVNAGIEQMAGLQPGMTVTVYSNGAMTMSLPAQIGAEFITVTETIID